MLVASRDPFHSGAHETPPSPGTGNRLTRTMGALQILGTILAIPVGLGSAYTMYTSNFTAEASCKALRANIIQILDKSVDASARHMLVRRDVVAFEQSCGSVDPDAAAAFKTLLAVEKTPASAAAAPVRRIETSAKAAEKPVERKIEAKAEPKVDVKVEAKAEPKVEVKPEAKQPAVKAVAAIAPAQRDPATSDAAWLEAVRGALVNPAPAADAVEPKAAEAKSTEPKLVEPKLAEPKPVEAKSVEAKPVEAKPVEAKSVEAKATISAPLLRQAVREAPPMNLENVRVPPLATVAAPLPPAAEVASAPAPQDQTVRAETTQAGDSHPVPPGAIPEAPPTDITPPEERSRIGALISHIPFVGRALDR